ncbi:MAG: CinA family protein [Microcella pacifica]|uniref:CinA family protein n=1 Tax=Microcella pacifica TaxID=2591847 RepID=UPI00331569CA
MTREHRGAAEVLAALARRGETLAFAESLTGGMLCDAFVSVPGASAVVRGAVVAYATPLKASLLGVPQALLARHGAVHPEVASRMAEGARTAASVGDEPADVGVATTGEAGPDASGAAPEGLVYVAVADARRTLVREHRFSGDRAQIRAQAVDAAIELLAESVGSRE